MRCLIIFLSFLFFSMTAARADDFVLAAEQFNNGDMVPLKYTCDGDNISPGLSWKNAPAKTQSFVLILYNPDASYGIFYNWVLYNLPASVSQLPEGANVHALPTGTLVGNTSSNDAIYRGPCPPNSAIHHYVFDLYALDTLLNVEPGADIDEVLEGIKNHILKHARLVGKYKH